ncbi:MAG: lysophospholipid acyltransferase family protein, partial [Salinisphaeraceae bacterium]|nr:lysophospholipid acyltransferase family protein [Salinisphaeraceae bacterium]
MKLLFLLLAHLPMPVLHTLGSILGGVLNLFPNRRRLRTRANIAACLPELSTQEQKRLVRQALLNLGRTTLETPRLWFGPEQTIRQLFHLESGADLLQAARAQGKGVILLSPHLNWEAAVLFTGLQGPSTFLYKPQNPNIEPLVCEGRGRYGTDFVHAVPGTVRQQLQEKLAAQKLLLVLPDQDPPRGRGVYADFFKVPAHSPTLVSRLARSSGAPVLLLQAERLPGSQGFAIRILPPPAGIDSEDKETGAAAVNAAMEQCI